MYFTLVKHLIIVRTFVPKLPCLKMKLRFSKTDFSELVALISEN